jgi:hypothetical protein
VTEQVAAREMTPEEAFPRLAHFGFLLLEHVRGNGEPSHLLVGMRRLPTYAHFDPEVVTFWRTDADGRGRLDLLTVESRDRVPQPIAWGTIRLVDRLGVENEFATLGGTLTATHVGGTMVAVFSSPAPILRLGGHSQAIDRVAAELAAFFGRMKVPIDFDPTAEPRIAGASPLARWAAFVAFEHASYASVGLRGERPEEASIIEAEVTRLRTRHPAEWAAGRTLLAEIGLEG